MSIRELDMEEGEEIPPSSDMHFNPRLELKATAFLDSLLGKLTEAENKKRVRATEMKRRILSCILANLVKAKLDFADLCPVAADAGPEVCRFRDDAHRLFDGGLPSLPFEGYSGARRIYQCPGTTGMT